MATCLEIEQMGSECKLGAIMSKTVTIRRYTVAVNSGFAPCRFMRSNGAYVPTDEITLANCMADMRRVVRVGEWVAGITPNRMTNRLAYLMKVGGEYTRAEYWEKYKGSRLDCIYKLKPNAEFGFECLPNSWHGAEEQPDDMKCHRILWGTEFYWFAQSYDKRTKTPQGLKIPSRYEDLAASQRTRHGVHCKVLSSFLDWVAEQPQLDSFKVLDGNAPTQIEPHCPSKVKCPTRQTKMQRSKVVCV